jgi:vanillate O-demethylase monooxygenase subunit
MNFIKNAWYGAALSHVVTQNPLKRAMLGEPVVAFRTESGNFAIGSEEVSELMRKQVDFAFTNEDEPMINAVAANMGTPDLLSLSPVLLPGDAAAVRVRRVLTQLRERHNAAAVNANP